MSHDYLNNILFQSVPLKGADNIFKFINIGLKYDEIYMYKTFEDDIRFKLYLKRKEINESYYIDDNYKNFLEKIHQEIYFRYKIFKESADFSSNTPVIKILGYLVRFLFILDYILDKISNIDVLVVNLMEEEKESVIKQVRKNYEELSNIIIYDIWLHSRINFAEFSSMSTSTKICEYKVEELSRFFRKN